MRINRLTVQRLWSCMTSKLNYHLIKQMNLKRKLDITAWICRKMTSRNHPNTNKMETSSNQKENFMLTTLLGACKETKDTSLLAWSLFCCWHISCTSGLLLLILKITNLFGDLSFALFWEFCWYFGRFLKQEPCIIVSESVWSLWHKTTAQKKDDWSSDGKIPLTSTSFVHLYIKEIYITGQK